MFNSTRRLQAEPKYKPRRAKKSSFKRPILILILSALGLVGIMTAAAVVLPARLPVDDPRALAVPMKTTATAPAPKKTATKEPERRIVAAQPKPTKSMKSTEVQKTLVKAAPKASIKPKKKVVPPKIIGTRYACTVLNIRAEGSLKARIVGTFQPREKVKIMNRVHNKFRMVRFEGKNRWSYQPCLFAKPPPKIKTPVIKAEIAKPPVHKATSKPSPKPSPKKTTTVKKRTVSAPKGVWDRLAKCESSGNWSINTGNGFYGGLQFTLGTWRAYGGSGMPNHASRTEQIRIAEKVRAARGGYGDWPACSAKLGLPR